MKLFTCHFICCLIMLVIILPNVSPRRISQGDLPAEIRPELSFVEKIVQAIERRPPTQAETHARKEKDTAFILKKIHAKGVRQMKHKKLVHEIVNKIKSLERKFARDRLTRHFNTKLRKYRM